MKTVADIVREEVAAISIDRNPDETARLSDTTRLVAELGFDSLAFVDLNMRLEERLGVRDLELRDWIDAESLAPTTVRHSLGSLIAFAKLMVQRSSEQHEARLDLPD